MHFVRNIGPHFEPSFFFNLIREYEIGGWETIDFAINAERVIMELDEYFCPANDQVFFSSF